MKQRLADEAKAKAKRLAELKARGTGVRTKLSPRRLLKFVKNR